MNPETNEKVLSVTKEEIQPGVLVTVRGHSERLDGKAYIVIANKRNPHALGTYASLQNVSTGEVWHFWHAMLFPLTEKIIIVTEDGAIISPNAEQRPPFKLDDSLSLEEAVFTSLGAASVCWDKDQVFMSEWAKEIGRELVRFIEHRVGLDDETEKEEDIATQAPANDTHLRAQAMDFAIRAGFGTDTAIVEKILAFLKGEK